ncbi:hypothetical protein [Lysobacter sp. Root983]|uniref:hypothetical protein n=1 Tax=Lysobacter sp. Root983 TaxID=1736613 RepID=UPI00138F56DD|nr:hypothetical protein [Lysobacter sp. Root983]
MNKKIHWTLTFIVSATSVLLSIYPIVSKVVVRSNALLIASLTGYLVVSTYLAIALMIWIDSKAFKLGKTVGTLTSTLLLLGFSWLVFGTYFYQTAVHGLESVDQLHVEHLLRESLQNQLILSVLAALMVIRKSGNIDLICAFSVSGILAILILG